MMEIGESYCRVEPLLGCGIAGVLQACEGINGVLPIVHGPIGCAAGHRIYPLFAGREPLVATTALTEIDVVLGGEDRVRAAVEKGIEKYHPSVIVIILTCATYNTRDIHEYFGQQIEEQYGIPCFVLNGSGYSVNEQDAYNAFIEAYRKWEDAKKLEVNKNAFELTGISQTDFGAEEQIQSIRVVLKEGLGIEPERIMFYDFTPGEQNSVPGRKIPAGYCWRQMRKPAPAPIGADGIRRWLESVASEFDGLRISEDYAAKIDELKTYQNIVSKLFSLSELRIAIESASWLGLGLARFLREEIGCQVLISTDEGSVSYLNENNVDVTVMLDCGNLEFYDAMNDFQAEMVFGTSFSKTPDRAWVPFRQPVWHVVESNTDPVGIDGTMSILKLLVNYVKNRRE